MVRGQCAPSSVSLRHCRTMCAVLLLNIVCTILRFLFLASLVVPEHGPLLGMMPGYSQPIHPQQPVWAVEQAHDPRRGVCVCVCVCMCTCLNAVPSISTGTMIPGERPFVHVSAEPRPPGLMSHPHYVGPPPGHPQAMMGRGFPRPHHPHPPGGQYLPPRHPGPGGYY